MNTLRFIYLAIDCRKVQSEIEKKAKMRLLRTAVLLTALTVLFVCAEQFIDATDGLRVHLVKSWTIYALLILLLEARLTGQPRNPRRPQSVKIRGRIQAFDGLSLKLRPPRGV